MKEKRIPKTRSNTTKDKWKMLIACSQYHLTCFFFLVDITERLYLIFLSFLKLNRQLQFCISCLLVKNSNLTTVFKLFYVSILI